MSDLKILHAADLHLDSAFEALPAGKAQLRRTEQRELLARLATLAREEQVQLILRKLGKSRQQLPLFGTCSTATPATMRPARSSAAASRA